jgi:hypothetical protein
MEYYWDGVSLYIEATNHPSDWANQLADACKAARWDDVFNLFKTFPHLDHRINACRPNGKSLYTPLHQAAYCGASEEIVRRLLSLGALRTIQNANGERPVDVAERKGHHHLLKLLKPRFKHHVPLGILLKIQAHFHQAIRSRIDEPLPNHNLRLPELEPLLELKEPAMWFPVPGMAGGFSYKLVQTGVNAKLVSDSWSRMADGSGQRHEITSRGWKLTDEGFV